MAQICPEARMRKLYYISVCLFSFFLFFFFSFFLFSFPFSLFSFSLSSSLLLSLSFVLSLAIQKEKIRMSTKIQKPKGKKPSELEQSVANAIIELETNVSDLRTDLRLLYITAAKEVVFLSCLWFSDKESSNLFFPLPL